MNPRMSGIADDAREKRIPARCHPEERSDEQPSWLSSVEDPGSEGWVPGGAAADHGVESDEQFSHTGGDGDLAGFAVVFEALVEVADGCIGSDRRDSGHVKRGSNGMPAAPDHALAAQRAGKLVGRVIEDAEVEARLASLTTAGMTPVELLVAYPPPPFVKALGRRLERGMGMDPDAVADGEAIGVCTSCHHPADDLVTGNDR